MSYEEAEKGNGGFLLGWGRQKPGVSHFHHCPFGPYPEAPSCSKVQTLSFTGKSIMVWPLAFLTPLGVPALESPSLSHIQSVLDPNSPNAM